MASWPTDVPFLCSLDALGYGGPEGDRAVFVPDAGPVKIRRRVTTAYRRLSGATPVLDATEFAAFETFWKTTLAGGTLPFEATHPVTGATATFISTGEPYEVRPVAAGRVKIGLSLFEVPA